MIKRILSAESYLSIVIVAAMARKKKQSPEQQGAHINIDKHSLFTHYASDILATLYAKPLQDRWETAYHFAVEQIANALTGNISDESKESLMKELLYTDFGQRLYESHLLTEKQEMNTPYYKKRKKPREPQVPGREGKRRGINYTTIGIWLLHHFLRNTYHQEFASEEEIKEFLEIYAHDSVYQLKEQIARYMSNVDEDLYEEDAEQDVMQKERPPVWRAYFLASLVLRKSTSMDEVEDAIIGLKKIEEHLFEELDWWQEEYVMPEFQDGGIEGFEHFLRMNVFGSARYVHQEIFENWSDLDIVDDYPFFSLLQDIMVYMRIPNEDVKLDKFIEMSKKYRDIAEYVEDDEGHEWHEHFSEEDW